MLSKYCGPGIAPPPNVFFCGVPVPPGVTYRLSSRNPFKLVALPVSLAALLSLPSKPNSEDEVERSGSRWVARAWAVPRRRRMVVSIARTMRRRRESAV